MKNDDKESDTSEQGKLTPKGLKEMEKDFDGRQKINPKGSPSLAREGKHRDPPWGSGPQGALVHKRGKALLIRASQAGLVHLVRDMINQSGWSQKNKREWIEEAFEAACQRQQKEMVEWWIMEFAIAGTPSVKRSLEGWDWAQERMRARGEKKQFSAGLHEGGHGSEMVPSIEVGVGWRMKRL